MIQVISFYKFFPIQPSQLTPLREKLIQKAEELQIKGLILIGPEGINASLCGQEKEIELLKKKICKLFDKQFLFKNSYCKKLSYRRLSVKIKKEIINIGKSYPRLKEHNSHLSPKQWENKLKSQAQILDIRNNYEVTVGKFKKAKHLHMENFQEFPNKLETSKLDKSKDTLIYCTGGIRCEKAIEIMKEKGFKKVYQLEGGILNYLERCPHSQFEKDCFVFDHRVALDQNLKPSKKYCLCPHCGQAGDQKFSCRQCNKPARICLTCKKQSPHYETCSKNCAYHFKAGHKCHKKFLNPSARLTNRDSKNLF